MTYERTVQAALAETRSKFDLAEALVLDIPPRDSGGSSADEGTVAEWLTEAREAIVRAGGEPRSVRTLGHYRLTADWVSKVKSSPELGSTFDLEFRWIADASFSAHNEARMAGIRYEDFVAKPIRTDEIRQRAGKAGTDGPPAKVVESWTPEQKGEAAVSLLNDPVVARNPDVESVVVERAASSPVSAAQVADRYQQTHPPKPRPEVEPSGLDYAAALGVGSHMLIEARSIASRVSTLVRAAATEDDETGKAALQEEIDKLRDAANIVHGYANEIVIAMEGGVSDERLAAFVDERKD